MILDNLIEDLIKIRSEHGGDLTVTTYGDHGQCSQIGHSADVLWAKDGVGGAFEHGELYMHDEDLDSLSDEDLKKLGWYKVVEIYGDGYL